MVQSPCPNHGFPRKGFLVLPGDDRGLTPSFCRKQTSRARGLSGNRTEYFTISLFHHDKNVKVLVHPQCISSVFMTAAPVPGGSTKSKSCMSTTACRAVSFSSLVAHRRSWPKPLKSGFARIVISGLTKHLPSVDPGARHRFSRYERARASTRPASFPLSRVLLSSSSSTFAGMVPAIKRLLPD